MGISDEDYANALEHQRLHERALMQLEYDKQIEEKKMLRTSAITGAGLNTITLGAGTGTTWASNISVQQPYGTFKVLTEEGLNHEAMKAPLSALVDMWMARWQGEWVNESEFQEDDFWRIAMIRLTGANKLEKHNLANQYTAVYRIIE